MGIQTPAANFITAWLWDRCFAKACQQRPNDHDRPAQTTAFCFKSVRLKEIKIDVFCFETESIGGEFLYLNTHIAKQLYQLIDILYIRNIAYSNFFAR